jgi:hypothetical protein
MTGAVLVVGPVGATVSDGGAVAVIWAVAGELTPAGLPAVAVSVCGPAVSVTLPGAIDHEPVGEAVTTTGVLPGTFTVTLLPGVAVPEMAGLRLVCVLVAGVLIATVGDGIAVTVICVWAIPAVVLAIAVMVLTPNGMFTAHEYRPKKSDEVKHNNVLLFPKI